MKKGVRSHPKFKLLRAMLGISECHAVGVLESLWMTAEEFCDDGIIGAWSDARIAASIGWDGDAKPLIAALIECGWLDVVDGPHRLIIHDWLCHCATHVWDRVGKRLARANGTTPAWLKRQHEKAKRERCRNQAGPMAIVGDDHEPPPQLRGAQAELDFESHDLQSVEDDGQQDSTVESGNVGPLLATSGNVGPRLATSGTVGPRLATSGNVGPRLATSDPNPRPKTQDLKPKPEKIPVVVVVGAPGEKKTRAPAAKTTTTTEIEGEKCEEIPGKPGCDSSSTTDKAMVFQALNGIYRIGDEEIQRLSGLWPMLDVPAELCQAQHWLARHKKRPPLTEIDIFIDGWLKKSADRPEFRARGPGFPATESGGDAQHPIDKAVLEHFPKASPGDWRQIRELCEGVPDADVIAAIGQHRLALGSKVYRPDPSRISELAAAKFRESQPKEARFEKPNPDPRHEAAEKWWQGISAAQRELAIAQLRDSPRMDDTLRSMIGKPGRTPLLIKVFCFEEACRTMADAFNDQRADRLIPTVGAA